LLSSSSGKVSALFAFELLLNGSKKELNFDNIFNSK
jgi:hypothetical protein